MDNLLKQTVILKIDFDIWKGLKPEFRALFDTLRVELDDYEDMIRDDQFCVLYSRYKKAQKELIEYKYNFRNGLN